LNADAAKPDSFARTPRLIPLTQVRLYMVSATRWTSRRFSSDCLAL
jgi:hypothetical protein